jgi:hypothetical protein
MRHWNSSAPCLLTSAECCKILDISPIYLPTPRVTFVQLAINCCKSLTARPRALFAHNIYSESLKFPPPSWFWPPLLACVETGTSVHTWMKLIEVSLQWQQSPGPSLSQYSGATGPLFMLNDGFSAISDASVSWPEGGRWSESAVRMCIKLCCAGRTLLSSN